MIVGYYRYKIIRFKLRVEIPESQDRSSPEKLQYYQTLNFLSLGFVSVASIGAMAVGNFRVSELIFFHFGGASICFLLMLIYIGTQTFIARFLAKHRVEEDPVTMIIAAMMGFFGCNGVLAFSFISVYTATWANWSNTQWRLHWDAEQPGYVWHCLATSSEWIAINSLCPMYFCLFNRMRKFAKSEQYRRYAEM